MSAESKVERIVTIVSCFIAAISLVAGAVQYSETRQRETKQPFLTRQLELYREVSNLTGALSTRAKGDSGFEEAQTRFWTLYYGELCLFEDREVAQAMVAYGNVLWDYTKTGKNHEVELQTLALKLNDACRYSLSKAWGVQLGELPKMKLDAEGGN
jgi:hypothetical protein